MPAADLLAASAPSAWHDDVVVDAVLLSLRVSFVATIMCLPFGVLIGAWLARTSSRLRPLVEIVTNAPLVLPPVVTGLALLTVLVQLGIPIAFTWWAAALASAIVALPLVVRTVRAAVESIDDRLPQVAATLGASPTRILFTVTLPLAWPGVVGGALLAWARAIGEFGATIVVAGNTPGRTQTIPLAIYSSLQSTTDRSIWPLVTVAVALSVAAIGVSEWMVARSRRRLARA